MVGVNIMFSLIYASLLAYIAKKGGRATNLGSLIIFLVAADLVALYIVFK